MSNSPTVFVFNPFSEGYIASGKRFTPVKYQAALAADLANLPQFLCRSDDVVLVPKRPSAEFLSVIKQAGFPLPEFVELKGERIDPASTLRHRKIGSLRPWAWGPDSVELLEALLLNVTGETRDSTELFNANLARLYSKAWSASFLRKVLAGIYLADDARASEGPSETARALPTIEEPWLCTEQDVGLSVNTLEEALEIIAAIRRRGHHRIIAKEAHGLAGHSAIRLWELEILPAQQQWLAHRLEAGTEVVIEPWLERELDFSVQLEMGSRGLKLCGYTGLINDVKGQFRANWAAADCDRRVPANVVEFFAEPGDISDRLQRLYSHILGLLEPELEASGYIGPVGIDAFVYRTPGGGRRLKPIVEINPRYTMGRLTLELMKRTSPGSCGLFRLVTGAQAKQKGFGDFISFARALGERFPLRFQGEPAPKLHQGALCLNDPTQAQVCLAVFQVDFQLAPLLDTLR